MTQAAAVSASNRLTATWASAEAPRDLVLSGFGVWVLLAVLAGGAGARVRPDLEAAVGLTSDEAMPAVRQLLDLLAGSPSVRAALGVWIRESVPLHPQWVGALPESLVERLPADPDQVSPRLDAWAREATEGEIDRLPITVTPETLLVLAGAILVRTRWLVPFTPFENTFAHGPWAGRTAVGLGATTPYDGQLRISGQEDRTTTVLTWPGRGDVDVHLLYGTERAAAGEVIAAGLDALGAAPLSPVDLERGRPGPGLEVAVVRSAGDQDELSVRTVAFDLTGSHDLLARAALFGLGRATNLVPGNFPGISAQPLAVSQAKQDAKARFTQEGFIAAAVTDVAMLAGARFAPAVAEVKRITFEVDRPFGYAAVHRPSGLVLVAGWVETPGTPRPA